MELNSENVRRLRGLIVFTAALIVCLWKYETVGAAFEYVVGLVFPLICGGAIAFVLNVPMNFVEQRIFPEEKKQKAKLYRRLARPVSLLIVFVTMVIVLGLVIFGVVPQLARTFGKLGRNIQVFIPQLEAWIENLLGKNQMIGKWMDSLEFDGENIIKSLFRFFGNRNENILDSTLIAARNIISAVSTFFIALVFAIYILSQKEKLKVQAKKVLFAFVRKGRAEAALEVLALTYQTFSNFLTGQCLEAVILGSMFTVSMMVLRLPYALLMGIVIAFTALIPIFGAFIGCGVGVFLLFMTDPAKAVVFVVLFLVLQQLEGNFIYPHVVGNSVGLPSIWVLAAVSIGGSLMGIVGMLIFIPMVSVLYALFREVVYLKLKKRGIRAEEISE